MQDGLNIIYYIFNKFITLIFDNFEIVPNVTIGWIIVSIIIISIMITNILSVAKSSQSHVIDRSNNGQ